MTRRLTVLFLGLNVLSIVLPLYGDDTSKRPVEVVHTERVNFSPGGVIHVVHSFGSLTVEGWDRPEVEVTVVKSRERYYEPTQHEQAARALERVRIVAERRSDRELAVSTILPHRRFPYLWGGKGDVMVEYVIHAPRDSRLVIQHGAGYASARKHDRRCGGQMLVRCAATVLWGTFSSSATSLLDLPWARRVQRMPTSPSPSRQLRQQQQTRPKHRCG